MNSKTTFRKTLAEQLASVVNSRELDGHLVQMQYVEDKHDVLGEFLDYYTEDLMKYEPFAAEFDSAEIQELCKFLDLSRSAMRGEEPWSNVQIKAGNLLAQLRIRGI